MRELFQKIKLTSKEREQARRALRAAMDMTPAEFMRMVHERERVGEQAPIFQVPKGLVKKRVSSPARKKKSAR